MSETAQGNDERKLTIDEIIDNAMTYLDIGAEALSPEEPDGSRFDMAPEKRELARATIVYMSFRLLLMHRIKHGNVIAGPRGRVGVCHHESEIQKEIASALGIVGPEADRIDEVKRLYKVASKREDEDEEYSKRIWSVMEGFIEGYDLDASDLGIIVI